MSSEAVISKIIFLPTKVLSSKKAFLISISASVVKRSIKPFSSSRFLEGYTLRRDSIVIS